MCDLRQLNKSDKSDTSIFPTPNEVMQSLSSTSQYFVKADLLQGYHQIALSDKRCNIFCFALEDDLYRYTRAPMGYTGSSHYFNRIIQKIMEDLTGVYVEIDNLLCKGKTMEEVLSTLRKVLTRCREKNIKLARHKLEFEKEIDFTGTHIGGPDGYRPTTAKINGIIDLPALTNITELRSFLGWWNQLHHYVPD